MTTRTRSTATGEERARSPAAGTEANRRGGLPARSPDGAAREVDPAPLPTGVRGGHGERTAPDGGRDAGGTHATEGREGVNTNG
ncbi:hypothetical protein [Halegenticoccus soli]|uniref:hypothetical protein n=1 Tax=Halegenticoccus soli TaxID=1985678 RepID=UPI000C6E760D|nr:hypothetical protein [Halegenticoccus soli]